MRSIVIATAVSAAIAVEGVCAQELVVNGSFEDTTTQVCDYNMSNAQFAATVAACAGFGDAESLDLLVDGTCQGAPGAVDGTAVVGMGSPLATFGDGTTIVKADAFSMTLTTPLQPGGTYVLDLFARSGNFVPILYPDAPRLIFGISDDPASSGVDVLQAEARPNAWRNVHAAFDVPPSIPSGTSYLTARLSKDYQSNAFLDAVSLRARMSLAVTASDEDPATVTIEVTSVPSDGTGPLARPGARLLLAAAPAGVVPWSNDVFAKSPRLAPGARLIAALPVDASAAATGAGPAAQMTLRRPAATSTTVGMTIQALDLRTLETSAPTEL